MASFYEHQFSVSHTYTHYTLWVACALYQHVHLSGLLLPGTTLVVSESHALCLDVPQSLTHSGCFSREALGFGCWVKCRRRGPGSPGRGRHPNASGPGRYRAGRGWSSGLCYFLPTVTFSSANSPSLETSRWKPPRIMR